MKKFVQALLLASFCLNASAETLKLVIAQDDLTAMNEPLVRQTHRALEAALPDYQIVIERTSRKMLLENVEHREAALFISSAAVYRQALPYGARDLATAVSIRAEDPNQSDAGLVLVRGEELSLQRIQDLEGKRVAFNPDQAGAQFDMVRLGIGLYGVSPIDNSILHNVSTLKTTILQIHDVPQEDTVGYSRKGHLTRPSRIAALPIGYADGLNRRLGNGHAYCLVNGQRAPYVGNICMDVCMIDVTDIDCKEGDSVEIFGDHLPVTVLSDVLETIPYEVLTSVSARVKRVYFQN